MIEQSVIEARIEELEAELTAYVARANATVQAYQASIGELKRLIAPTPQTEYVEQETIKAEQ